MDLDAVARDLAAQRELRHRCASATGSAVIHTARLAGGNPIRMLAHLDRRTSDDRGC
jgi:hypothetical protein